MDKEKIFQNIKEEALKNHVPIVEDDSLEYIEKLLKEKKPNKILEIGTAVGYSAICFSKYLSGDNSKITTIEINENMYNIAKENISKMELEDKIEVILSDATEYMKKLDSSLFDFVFIDAAKGQYLVYLEQAIRLSKIGGIIVADNMFYRGRTLSDYNEHKHRTATNRLRKYLEVMVEDSRLNSELVNVGDGLAVSRVINK